MSLKTLGGLERGGAGFEEAAPLGGVKAQGCADGGVGGCSDALEGGEVPPPPSRAPSLRPATVPLTPSAGFNGICN